MKGKKRFLPIKQTNGASLLEKNDWDTISEVLGKGTSELQQKEILSWKTKKAAQLTGNRAAGDWASMTAASLLTPHE